MWFYLVFFSVRRRRRRRCKFRIECTCETSSDWHSNHSFVDDFRFSARTFFRLAFFYFSLLKWIHMYNYANELASDTHSYVLHAWNIQLFLTFFSSPGIWQAWLIFIDFWKLAVGIFSRHSIHYITYWTQHTFQNHTG